MDFQDKMNLALDFLEEHLDRQIDFRELAGRAGCSEYHFSRMFSSITGQSLSGYIRRRRLSRAAVELMQGSDRLLDVAVKYGYSSADSFARAFREMHGLLPSQVKAHPASVRILPRIRCTLSITGGEEMTYRIVEKEAFRIVGIKKHVKLIYHGANPEIDAMWSSLEPEQVDYWKRLSNVEPNGIISASVNFSEDRMAGAGTLDHYIGAATVQAPGPGDSSLEVDAGQWAVFTAEGPFPETLQNSWGRIYSEWFPVVPYEAAPGPEILWNEHPDTSDPNFKSEIWIPVKRKDL